jgi:hypothetical protein
VGNLSALGSYNPPALRAATYVACGSKNSDVLCQALGARLVVSRPCGREFVGGWLVQGRGRDLETSVIKL